MSTLVAPGDAILRLPLASVPRARHLASPPLPQRERTNDLGGSFWEVQLLQQARSRDPRISLYRHSRMSEHLAIAPAARQALLREHHAGLLGSVKGIQGEPQEFELRRLEREGGGRLFP